MVIIMVIVMSMIIEVIIVLMLLCLVLLLWFRAVAAVGESDENDHQQLESEICCDNEFML